MPMPPDANAIFAELNPIVVTSFAEALANTKWAPESDSLIKELDVPETVFNFNFMLDTFGLKKMKKNLTKKGVVQKMITMAMSEWEDNITLPERELKTSAGASVKMQAEMRGASVPRWKDQEVASLLTSVTGDAFTKLSFDGVPFFSTAHPMNIGGDESMAAYSNLDNGGAGDYWFLFDDSLIKPILLNWKTRPRLDEFGPETEHARLNHEVMWNVYADAGFGMGLWHFGAASNQVLNETHFDSLRKLMTKVPTYAKGEKGNQLMGIKPKTLVVGSSNYLAAKKLIGTATINGGDPNPFYNAVRVVDLSMLP